LRLLRFFASMLGRAALQSFGDPKGGILRVSSTMGFNPAWSRGQRRPITPHVESFRGRTVRTARTGSVIKVSSATVRPRPRRKL